LSVTILTPTLNAARYLPTCLASLRAQRTVGIRHLVLDGGSTDGTAELARGAGAEVHVERDGSLYEALNRGVESADGDVVGWLNADDALEPGALERVSRAFERSRDLEVVVGDYAMASASATRVVRTRADALSRIRQGCRAGTWVSPLAVFFRTEVLRALGPYDTSYRSAADLDMWLRAAARRPPLRVEHAGTILGTFRVHPGSLSSGSNPRPSLVESMTVARSWYEDPRQEPGLRRYALFVYRRYAHQLQRWDSRDQPAAQRVLATLRCIALLHRLGPGTLGDIRTPVTP
jgi:glycosyltransferase involved in cell wall biosynthesis